MKYAALVKAIHSATAHSQGRAAMAVNQALILHNWLVGEWILEFQEHGKDRAKYGTRLLETLAADLKAKEIKGFTAAVFRQCLLFCSFYPQIRQTQSVEFPIHPNSDETVPRIPATLSPETAAITRPGTNVPLSPIRQKLSAELPTPLSQQALFKLSWSHFQELIAIDEPRKRAFFENECIQSNWSDHERVSATCGELANIGAVAPGAAAQALVTTVAGLFVAIPAVIWYNLFAARLDLFVGELDGFSAEFIGTLAREGKV